MTPDLDDLPAPSSLLSSRWSRDNLVTMHPSRLYDGQLVERVEPETLEYLVQELEKRVGPLQVGAGRMGVLTWDIACEGVGGPFVLQVPRALDERGRRGRAMRDVPRQNVENMRHFRERGLARFVVEPREFMLLADAVPAALFAALPAHRPLGFGRGAVQVEVSEGKRAWFVGLGPQATASALAEVVAALVYHYEPDADGGTAVADVSVNDGDFAIRRRNDGSIELRLTALRRREKGIGPSLLLLYLTQMLAYEDWTVDDSLVGLPALISNPSITFEGLVRGLRYRARDLGLPEQGGEAQALDWIRAFGRSREGRGYRPWVDRFLAGRLPLSFGGDLREHWWRLVPLETKHGLLELRGRAYQSANEANSARALRSFLDRLTREIGRRTEDDSDRLVRINDVGSDGLERLLAEAQLPPEPRAALAERIFSHWPYRSLDHLLGKVPAVRALRRLKSRIAFGQVVPDADQGTLRSLAVNSNEGDSARPVANREMLGRIPLAEPLGTSAVHAFPTFETYMDSALHDPRWGYYARHVVIGEGGHFATHPEILSPHYGRWLASWAFKAWRDLLEHGELTDADSFPIIEFGAGNGRLARDVLDAIRARAADSNGAEHRGWSAFAARAQYHIYERSESLRQRQRELLGARASIAEGDARRPAETLKRDFPSGVRGFIVTNEVPDAFGVHKVVISAEGVASAALVVPRAELALREMLSPELAHRIAEANETIRTTFGFQSHPEDFYLEKNALLATLEAISGFPAEEREARLALLWFEEAYVPVALIPALAEQLSANASEYAIALAAGDSGVVLYVNVHAADFMRELGASLAAGFVVTIDYGDATFGLVQGARRGDFPFRVYRDSADYRPRPNDPYAAPGEQDMTADVDFTALTRAGRDAGLELVHFGHERDVSGEDLPELLRAAAEQPAFAKFLGNPVFKVLVLGTRQVDLFGGPFASPIALSHREQDIPKARRQKIASIERAILSVRPAH
jgi:SAM-dependent MidA family methyltransferase